MASSGSNSFLIRFQCMLDILANTNYARLFAAQVVALLGTGLMTVALSLLAFDLAGDAAGVVLGVALTIKMIVYVGLSPLAHAAVDRLPAKTVLIGADILRAAVALFLPFVDAIWQIYVLIFVLQAASATFTPAFQATIPDLLPDEKDYTKALSLSRLAYDLENLISPVVAGLLLAVMSYHWLFGGTVIGFVQSTLLVAFTVLPARKSKKSEKSFASRATRGIWIYLATPRLRGLLALNLAAASIGAFVIVNTVVLVQGVLSLDQSDVAYALAAFGAGSMLTALALPGILDRLGDRTVMVTSAFSLSVLATICALILLQQLPGPAWLLLLFWFLFGLFYAAILTPSGRLLRHSAHAEDRPAIFAAQFALSHACWLLTYPLAGWLGNAVGLSPTLAVLAAMAFVSSGVALFVWPAGEPDELVHEHKDLPPDHPHLQKHAGQGKRHRHAFVIDDEHRAWPTHG